MKKLPWGGITWEDHDPLAVRREEVDAETVESERNIILGQLDNFSGYEAEGANRVLRALDLLLNLGQAHWGSILIGATTIALIVTLERTPTFPPGISA